MLQNPDGRVLQHLSSGEKTEKTYGNNCTVFYKFVCNPIKKLDVFTEKVYDR